MKRHLSVRQQVLLFACLLLATRVSETQQDEVVSTTNQNVEINNNHEKIEYGNTKTKNYNFMEHNYAPSQLNQLVLNVGKAKNKLRKSRPPTLEEYEIKRKILQVYELAQQELGSHVQHSANFVHLGRILKALNPKYIATERVMRVAFANPLEPEVQVIPPELETLDAGDLDRLESQRDVQADAARLLETLVQAYSNKQAQCQPPSNQLVLSGDGAQIDAELPRIFDELHDRFQTLVTWDKSFANRLLALDEDQFDPTQAAFKNLIQCLSYPMACGRRAKLSVTKQPGIDQADRLRQVDDYAMLDEHQPLEQVVQRVAPQQQRVVDIYASPRHSNRRPHQLRQHGRQQQFQQQQGPVSQAGSMRKQAIFAAPQPEQVYRRELGSANGVEPSSSQTTQQQSDPDNIFGHAHAHSPDRQHFQRQNIHRYPSTSRYEQAPNHHLAETPIPKYPSNDVRSIREARRRAQAAHLSP